VSQVRSTIRCAVYTRKSSEEGLEQSFNSLHAQREACEAYVLSQRHEGWQLLPAKYDDGGFSGGNMERPGLKKLLDDIASKKVDTLQLIGTREKLLFHQSTIERPASSTIGPVNEPEFGQVGRNPLSAVKCDQVIDSVGNL